LKNTSNRNQSLDIIACGVFQNALEYLALEERYPQLSLTFLPANLHLRPQKLEKILAKKISITKKRSKKTLCIYGNCFPYLDKLCGKHGVTKVPGHHCFAMLLGKERYEKIINQTPGTYFLEKDLILNLKEHCLVPLELYDEEMRRSFFVNYQKMVYVRQPSDPDLVPQAGELARFLGLSLKIQDADYSYLDQKLVKLIEVSD
jgi:hypothetical protein